MTRPFVFLLTSILFTAWMPVSRASADSKELLIKKKCNDCHSVQIHSIEKKPTKKGKLRKGPDLSGTGLDHDAAWFTQYLNKEIEKKSNYSDKQVKHKKKFKGTPDQLKSVVQYMTTLKTRVDVPDEGEEKDEKDEEDKDD